MYLTLELLYADMFITASKIVSGQKTIFCISLVYSEASLFVCISALLLFLTDFKQKTESEENAL